jgi:hypothetical protein
MLLKPRSTNRAQAMEAAQPIGKDSMSCGSWLEKNFEANKS